MSYCNSYGHHAVAHGRSGGVVFYPADMEGMIYLGTHQSSEPIKLQCGKCGYQGPSDVKRERGLAYYMTAILTLGIAKAIKKCPKEIHHYCPGCGLDAAYSKPL